MRNLTSRIQELERRHKEVKPKSILIKPLNWQATPEELAKIPQGAVLVRMWLPKTMA